MTKTASEWRELLSRKAVEKTAQFEAFKAWYQPQIDTMFSELNALVPIGQETLGRASKLISNISAAQKEISDLFWFGKYPAYAILKHMVDES